MKDMTFQEITKMKPETFKGLMKKGIIKQYGQEARKLTDLIAGSSSVSAEVTHSSCHELCLRTGH